MLSAIAIENMRLEDFEILHAGSSNVGVRNLVHSLSAFHASARWTIWKTVWQTLFVHVVAILTVVITKSALVSNARIGRLAMIAPQKRRQCRRRIERLDNM
jgi:hypothetical protein